jgi:hypothetical protein
MLGQTTSWWLIGYRPGRDARLQRGRFEMKQYSKEELENMSQDELAGLFVQALSEGLYNDHLRKAKAGHKTLQFHFFDWYGKDWKTAEMIR